jgi:ATP-dependent DNA helicase RecG
LPPDYLAFREAAINLLMHQDFADHNRKALIQFYRDRTVLTNPGDLFAEQDELLEPVEKTVRNPRIVATFRRIGLSDQAGTGFRTMYRACDRLGWVPPIVENDKARKAFGLHLPKEKLLSEEQLLFQANLGANLSENEAKAFAVLCRRGELRVRDVRAVTGLSTAESQSVIDRLIVEVLVEPKQQGNKSHVQLSEHLQKQPQNGTLAAKTRKNGESDQPQTGKAGLVTDQPSDPQAELVTDQASSGGIAGMHDKKPLIKLSEQQRKIVLMCDVYRSLADLMKQLGITHRTFFRRSHLEPLLQNGVLVMRHPDVPNHPDQAYTLSPTGVAIAEAIREQLDDEATAE